MKPGPIHTRRELEARLIAALRPGRRQRGASPSLFDVIAGVTAFLGLAAACLYAVARLGA